MATTMEPVQCRCKSCGAKLGEFVNVWTQVGRSYFIPIIPSEHELDVTPRGAVRVGDKATLVEGCRLQDIACVECEEVVGLQCISTPTNHVLDSNQTLLRLTSCMVISTETGDETELNVKRLLTLRSSAKAGSEPERDASASPPPRARTQNSQNRRSSSGPQAAPQAEEPEISQIQAEIEIQRADIQRLDNAGYQVVSAIDTAVRRIEGEVNSLRDSLRDLRRDLGGKQDDLGSLKTEIKEVKRLAQDTSVADRLEAQIQSSSTALSDIRRDLTSTSSQLRKEFSGLKSELQQVRREVDKVKNTSAGGTAASKDQAKELASLRSEVAQLRRQMVDQQRSKAPEAANTPFGSREMDIITSNIAKLGNRASQVETLQMEFQILKGRVQRLESHSTKEENRRLSEHGLRDSMPPGPQQEPYHTPDGPSSGPPQRKRRSPGLDVTFHDMTSSKRPALSSSYTHTPTEERETPSESSPRSSPQAAVVSSNGLKKKGDATRATKSGVPDKRYPKRGPRKLMVGI